MQTAASGSQGSAPMAVQFIPTGSRAAADDGNANEGKRLRIAGIETFSVDEREESVLEDANIPDELEYDDPVLEEQGVQKAIDRMLLFGGGRDTPVGKQTGKFIDARWEKVYKWGEEEKDWIVKARWVGREYKWQEFRDDLYTPGAGASSYRVIDRMALEREVTTFTGDASDAFFHADEEEPAWIRPPPEYLERLRKERKDTNIVWQLLKTLPGMGAAGMNWIKFISREFVERGFLRSPEFPQFYYRAKDEIGIEIHMGDFHGFGKRGHALKLRDDLRRTVLLKTFDVHGPGSIYNHLKRMRYRVSWTQMHVWGNWAYVEKVIDILGLANAKPATSLGVPGNRRRNEDDQKLEVESAGKYRTCVGCLMFYALDRADIQCEVSLVGSGLREPTERDMQALKRIVRYLIGTKKVANDIRKTHGANKEAIELNGYSDSDWAIDELTRKSQSSCKIMCGSALMYSYSRRQAACALSSGESEVYAACGVCSELLGLAVVFRLFGLKPIVSLCMDSSAARAIAKREGVGKIKHLDLRVCFMQSAVKKKLLSMKCVHADVDLADLGTKILGTERVQMLSTQ